MLPSRLRPITAPFSFLEGKILLSLIDHELGDNVESFLNRVVEVEVDDLVVGGGDGTNEQ